MDFEIVWSKRSQKDVESIIRYLKENWPEVVLLNFQAAIFSKIEIIFQLHNIGLSTENDLNKRSIPITKHTRLFYKIGKRKITIVTLFDTRQNPKKLKKIGVAEPIEPYGLPEYINPLGAV